MPQRARRLAVGLLAAVAGVFASASPASATFPGDNGRIIFHALNGSAQSPSHEFYTVNEDGSELAPIFGGSQGHIQDVTWSPDGRQFAFTRAGEGTLDLAIADADGSNVRQITDTPDNTEQTPAWSPDGRALVFADHDSATGQMTLARIDVDGTGRTDLTTPMVTGYGSPDWSPDGSQIAYYSHGRGSYYDLWVMDTDGSNQTQLTFTDNENESMPSWSPDGTTILYSGNAIYTIRPDGTDRRILVNGGQYEGGATWSPDGTRIAYWSSNGFPYGAVVVAGADGSDPHAIVTGQASPYLSPGYLDWGVRVAGDPPPTDTAPEIFLRSPADDGQYDVGEAVAAAYFCIDDVDPSEELSCVGTVADGEQIDTATRGVKTFTVTATDSAGNTTREAHTYKVGDTEPPQVTLTAPAEGAIYFVGDRVSASYSCRDARSGVASCVGTVANGGQLQTSSVGERRVTVSAVDREGNESSTTHAYRVIDPIIGGTDSDGDSLLDSWERDGIDVDNDGNVDLRLNAAPYNADPNHKDVYLEVDYMSCALGGCAPGVSKSYAPAPGVLSDTVDAFAAAPVPNPDGTSGVRLHALLGDPVTAHRTVRFWDPAKTADIAWDELKSGGPEPCDGAFGTSGERSGSNCANTLTAKRLAFHYVIFGRSYAENTRSSGVAELFGNDLMVTVGDWGDVSSLGGQRSVESGTLMHELGHNLGLYHGGRDDNNCKPNYLSVMSYSLQFANIDPERRLDYSPEALPSLDEAALEESIGVRGPAGRSVVYGVGGIGHGGAGDGPIDWNGDALFTGSGIAANINYLRSGGCAGEGSVLAGHDDWENLSYNFRRSGNLADGVREQIPVEVTKEEAVAVAETADFDGDGVRNLDDACRTDAAANDLDGDGTSDRCDKDNPASIDVIPGAIPNAIKISSRAPVPVAILSTATFSAPKRVNRSSLTFGRTGDEQSLASCQTGERDVNNDRRPDLVCMFSIAKSGLRTGDTTATLKGRTLTGASFYGRNAVRVTR